MTDNMATSTLSAPKQRKPLRTRSEPEVAAPVAVTPESKPESKWILVDEKPRSVLSEGRSRGLGAGFAKRNGNVLTMVGPISACKDYLSDQIYSEHTGKPYSACGYHAKKDGCFDTHAYQVIAMLMQGARTPTAYPGYEDDVKALASNWRNMQAFVNHFEALLKVNGRTVIDPISDNRYAMTIPLFWAQATYLISLHGLLLRVALRWDGKDADAFARADNIPDAYLMKEAVRKVNLMIKDGVPAQDFDQPNACWHNMGIVGWQWTAPKGMIGAPFVEVKS